MSKTTTIIREGESCEVTCINPGKVKSLARSLHKADTVERISGIFQIMRDPRRLKILHCLSQGEVCVRELSPGLGTQLFRVSHQPPRFAALPLFPPQRGGRSEHQSLSDPN